MTSKPIAAFVVAVAIAVAGCGDDDFEQAVPTDEAADDPSDDVVDVPDDAPTVPKDADGIDGDAFEPVEIPEVIPMPEDHELVEAIGTREAGFTIIANSTMRFGDVADFYEAELPAAGWESIERARSVGADVIRLEAEMPSEGESISVQVTSDDAGSTIEIQTDGGPG